MLRRVLFVSHTHPFGTFRVGSHHYARTFAELGMEVVHLSTPISRLHYATGRVRTDSSNPVPTAQRDLASGVINIVPRTLIPRPFGSFRVDNELSRHKIDTSFDAVLVDQPLLWDRSIRALAPRLIYRPTDVYESGIKTRLQRRILGEADGVVATSSEVLRALGRVDLPTLELPNGVDTSIFVLDGPEVAPRPPVCVYVGSLDDRFDWETVLGWARSYPQTDFLIAGPTDSTPPHLPANIKTIGAVEYGQIPDLLKRARVGLLPLSADSRNAGRSPMKLYEYLASGLSVVSRETPVIREEEGIGLFTYNNMAQAQIALSRALAHDTANLLGSAHAARASWQNKSEDLIAFIETLPR